MNYQEALGAYADSAAAQIWDFESFKKIVRDTEPYHYVPFMTGYEIDIPFISACGRDVTCGFFYCSVGAFLGMPAVVPVRRCRECEDMVEAGAVLFAVAACVGAGALGLSRPSPTPESRLPRYAGGQPQRRGDVA